MQRYVEISCGFKHNYFYPHDVFVVRQVSGTMIYTVRFDVEYINDDQKNCLNFREPPTNCFLFNKLSLSLRSIISLDKEPKMCRRIELLSMLYFQNIVLGEHYVVLQKLVHIFISGAKLGSHCFMMVFLFRKFLKQSQRCVYKQEGFL